ncbi:MAG: hypothetical protein LQ344_005278 [Seirophora lacunosa]|nr:MAG: hypothetical protein LQ344_005278 [Seirophora lacunosa]
MSISSRFPRPSSGITPVTHVSEAQVLSQRARSTTPAFNLLNSKYENIWMKAMRKETEDRLKKLRRRNRTRPTAPDLLALPSTITKPIQVDPEDPLALAWQRTLWYAFENFGRIGVAVEMYQYAANAAPHTSWNKVIVDEQAGKASVLILLMGLTDDVIRSLIRNTLPHDISRNPDLGDFARTCMQSREAPAIYCMALASNVSQILTANGPRPRSNPGRWLSPDQNGQLADTCEEYQDDAPTARFLNQSIDSWQRKDRWPGPGRRWTSRSFQNWLQCFRDLYCENIDPAKTTTPWVKCPFEVGFAVNTSARLRQHATNSNTNSIWALVHAIARLSPSSSGFGLPAPKQWELFVLFEDDEPYAQLGEIVGSMLCSSYWLHGGLNPVYAGSASLSRIVHQWGPDHPKWMTQVVNLAERLELAEYPDVEHDRFASLRRALAALLSQTDKEAEISRLELKLKDQREIESDTKERWKKKLRELGVLGKKLDDRDDEVVSSSQDATLVESLSLERHFRNADLIRRFVSMDIRTFTGARKTTMEEQGISESIQGEVETRVKEEHQAAALRFKEPWLTTRNPRRTPLDRRLIRPPPVIRSRGYELEREEDSDADSEDVLPGVEMEMESEEEAAELTDDEIESFDETPMDPEESRVEGDPERG